MLLIKNKILTTLLITITIALIFISCSDNGIGNQSGKLDREEVNINYVGKEKMKKDFGVAFAKALEANHSLRELIKKEALKKFDKDFDVLYHMIKDKELSENKTVHQLLSGFFEKKIRLKEIENKLPLITIFVPTLPEDSFSAKDWDTRRTIPSVGVALNNNNKVPIFDKKGKKYVLTREQIPAFPVVIVKDNERVIANDASKKISTEQSFYTSSDQNFNFSFIDKKFDGREKNNPEDVKMRTWWTDGIDIDEKKAKAAWNLDIDWQRDYIYYDLEPGQEKGPFDNDYKEYITSIKFINSNGLYQISNSSSDPSPIGTKFNPSSPSWTDGIFEFRVNALINSKNGVGQNILKVFAASGEDLFNIEYEQNGIYYQIKSIKPIEFWPYKLEIAPWNLQDYGSA